MTIGDYNWGWLGMIWRWPGEDLGMTWGWLGDDLGMTWGWLGDDMRIWHRNIAVNSRYFSSTLVWLLTYVRIKNMHWYHQFLARPRENNKIFQILKKSEDSYKLNMIWNMIEVKIAAITVRCCAKCLEFLAGKRKTRLKWLSVSKDAQ